MNKRLKRIILAGFLFALAVILSLNNIEISPILFIISYIIVGYDVIFKAVRNIFHGNVFDENFLMTIATIGAFIIKEYPEAVAIMLFYQIGEFFQDYAVNKSRKSVADLMDIRPDYANLKKDGDTIKIDPDEVQVGDIILIKPGERVPLDALILEGYSTLDVSALTGESLPVDVQPDSKILSGSINLNGLLTAEVTSVYEESTASKILDLVENASSKKSQTERFITRFARYYTPIVVILALLLALLPPLLLAEASFADWFYRSISFLVVSCPCALVVSVPLSFFGGIGGASQQGILVKGSNYLETLAQVRTIVFDKTGTLTKGVFEVQEINPVSLTEDELIELTAYAEHYSNHPIADSIKKHYKKEINKDLISKVEEIPGHGVIANVKDKKIYAGNIRLMEKMKIDYPVTDIIGTVVHVAVDEVYGGYILIADEIKADSAKTISQLKKSNIGHLAMLTGDNQKVGKKVANDLGIYEVYSELLPADKVATLEQMLDHPDKYGKIAFVGDGINDAPVLTRSDVGIAMGALGSDAAIEAADIVIMTDEPSKILTVIKISKKTLNIASQNTIFAIGIKVLVLILSTFGLASLWAAVFADVGVTIIAILNSLRALKVDNM